RGLVTLPFAGKRLRLALDGVALNSGTKSAGCTLSRRRVYPLYLRQATMSRDTKGRRKGSRNKGFFYRDGRGWFTKDKAQRFVPLSEKSGARIKDKSAVEAAKDAYARYVVALGEAPKQAVGRGVTVSEVCDYYLARAQQESRASTVDKRADTLFDLVYGLPAS